MTTQITQRQYAAISRLGDVAVQVEELKSLAWMLDEISNRGIDWTSAAPSCSLLYRQLSVCSCTLENIHSELSRLPEPAKTEGGAA